MKTYDEFLSDMFALPAWELREGCGIISGCRSFFAHWNLTQEQAELMGGRRNFAWGPLDSNGKAIVIENLIQEFHHDPVASKSDLIENPDRTCYGMPVTYYLAPHQLLKWAIGRGYILPEPLQNLSGYLQINDSDVPSKPELRKFFVQAYATFLWGMVHDHTIRSIIHELKTGKLVPSGDIQQYLKGTTDKTLRDVIKEVDPRPPEQSRGRKSKNRKVIPEWQVNPELVMSEGGILRYDFFKLQRFLTVVGEAFVWSDVNCNVTDLLEFPPIKIYWSNASQPVREWIESTLEAVLAHIQGLEYASRGQGNS